MLATFIIELCSAFWVMWRYRSTHITKLSVLLLLCLAVFQLVEYNVCEGAFGLDSLMWARIGHIAITLLPPLGIHLTALMVGDKRRWHVASAYSLAVVFSAIFAFSGQGIHAQQCLGNYVIFSLAPHAVTWYAAYYYGLLFFGLGYIAKHFSGSSASIKQALGWFAFGHMAFIIPTAIANLVDPATIAVIPSIMCGFAVIFAVILTIRVLPALYDVPNQKRYSKRAAFKI